jgi:N utilization substance protein B
MSRKKAREMVLCLVFEREYHKDTGCEELYESLFELTKNGEEFRKFENSVTEADKEYIKSTFFGVIDNIAQIDDILSGAIVGWEYSRISKISMALLRIAVYEIMNMGNNDVTPSVAINEAVELSKIYDDSKAYGFVNGVLASVAKSIRRV